MKRLLQNKNKLTACSNEPPEELKTAMISSSILEALAIVHGDDAVKMIEQDITPNLYPISADQQKAAQEAEDEAERNPTPGHLMRDGTIYLGRYKPKDHDGHDLGKIFNVFAAPKDLETEAPSYHWTVEDISKLKNWHGYNGTNYEDDKEIYNALKDGSYDGGWIIPPRDLLDGTAPDALGSHGRGKITQSNNLFDHRNTGAFQGTFKSAISTYPDGLNCYWSSTKSPRDKYFVWSANFSIYDGGFFQREYVWRSCRPVRLVEIKLSPSGAR